MGIQGSNISDVTDVTGASVLVIDQACENTQLLVSLCRNGKEWLSPVGWTEKQKITLLDCRSQGRTTEIDIPAEFSKSLITGDKLVLKCSELDLTQEIVWDASHQVTQRVADLTPAATGLAGGLFSRFKSIKSSEVTDLKSEAQLRAEEADLAAESYRAKMEVATAAKEDAQRRALDAAREAEAALKMEAERISDMERAAKAFEEAERLKQDGLRRVQEERRQEEARIAEENLRIEEAHKREEAAKLAVERKAAMERYETALDETQHQETRLEDRLSRLKTDTSALEIKQSEQAAILSSLQSDFGNIQNRVGTTRKAYEAAASKLEGLNSDLKGLESKSYNLSAEGTEISEHVVAVEAEYLTAQKEAEMAIATAEEKRNLLEAAREEKDIVHSRLNTLSRDVETQKSVVSETTVKTQKLQLKFETAQADLSNASMDIESLESGAFNLSDSIQTSRVEIEATQQAVEDCRARQSTHQAAIAHLEAGGTPDNVSEFDLKTHSFIKEDDDYSSLDAEDADGIQLESSKPAGLFGRVRRNFSRSKDAEISIEVDDVLLAEEPETDVLFEETISAETHVDDAAFASDVVSEPFTVEDIIAEPELKTERFARRHSKSLLAIGTILASAAFLGGGFLVSKANQPQVLTVKTSSPTATKTTLSAEQNKAPALETAIIQSAVQPAVEAPVVMAVLSSETSLPALEPKATKLDIPDIPVPNLTLTGLSLDNVPVKTPAQSKFVTVKKTTKNTKKVKVIPKVKKLENSSVLTTRVQTQLQTLGLYSGGLNGQNTAETTEAIKTFQQQYSLAPHGRLSSNFLTALKNADAKHKQNQKNIVIQEALPQNINSSYGGQASQFVEASFSQPIVNANIYNPVAPTTDSIVSNGVSYDGRKIIRDTTVVLSAVSAVAMVQNPEIAKKAAVPLGIGLVVASSAAAVQNAAVQNRVPVVQEATAPIITSPTLTSSVITPTVQSQVVPPVQNVVVKAQRTKPAKATYPKTALAKGYLADVRIIVGYDIDPFGKVVNTSILTNNHSGRFNSAFERAAKAAVKKQKFIAKTINGLPVASVGQKQRIVFKSE